MASRAARPATAREQMGGAARAAGGGALSPVALARLHGLFNLAGGVWPLVHLPSFEAVLGPKADRWLVRTVAGLMVVNGVTQLTAAPTPEALASSRRLGIGTAATLAAIDVRYAPTGRISRMYLVDAVLELAWVAAWATTRRHTAVGRPAGDVG